MALFGMVQVVFVVVICLAMAVPNSPIRHNLRHDVAVGTLSAKDYPLDRNGGVIDKYSQCASASMGVSSSYWSRLVYDPIYYNTRGACAVVVAALTGQSSVQPQPYFRYWNGWVAVSRPLLAVSGLVAVEIGSGVLMVAAFLYLLREIRRSLGRATTLAVGAAILLTTNFIWLPLSFPHAISMAAALGSTAAALSWTARREGWFIAPLLAGSVLCFFDMLISQNVAWILTTGLVAAVATHRGIPALRAATTAAVGWMTGFAGTWAVKWLLVLVILGPHAVKEVIIREIEFRVSTRGYTWWDPFKLTFKQWVGGGHHRYLVPVLCLVLIAALLSVLVSVRRTWRVALPIAAPAVFTPLWFLALRNHSAIQAFFTYRDWAASLAVILVGLCVASDPAMARGRRRQEHVAPGIDAVRSCPRQDSNLRRTV